MNEIATRESRDIVDGWVHVATDILKLAKTIADTQFVPKQLRGNAPAVAAAIFAGREVGVGPMTSLQHIHVIDGRPSMSSELMRSRLLAAGHEIVYEELTSTRCRVKGRRKGAQSWTTVEWSADDARKANLLGKDNWRKYPGDMLVARATGKLARLIAPDALGGISYTSEELSDEGGEGTVVEAQPKRTARRKSAAPKETEGAPVEAPVVEVAAVEAPPLPGEDGYSDVVAEGHHEHVERPLQLTPEQDAAWLAGQPVDSVAPGGAS
ncbi:hypothetical protein [Allonocardiopsis opalescens]|uniref:RecT family protein n=1 Tax=Allonocardiopsis opalescens TaxID=1144618 RepID=A0A2T0PP87_9ACTN|nr:hypothetical protein [Allonocardiopsis opalescens]PRX90697.1 hypothetical protein CLV72_11835 [Allonocardiopsis opalescens]